MGNQISQTAAPVEAAVVKEEQQEVQQQGTATSPMESRNESSSAQEDMICETPLTVEVESDDSVVEEEESPESKQNTETTTASSTPSVLSSVASSSSCGVTLLQSLFPRPTPFVPLSEFASPLRDSDDDDEDHDEDASYTTLPCAPAYWTSPKSDASEAATASTSPTNSSTPTLFRSASLTSFFTQQLEYTPQEMLLSETRPVPVSDLSRPRPVWIVTTAALPWMTGTAVNPLLRAACLWETYYKQQQEESAGDESSSSENEQEQQQQTTPIEPDVHVVLPWLEVADDRVKVYGADWAAATPAKQEAYLRTWMRETANYPKASASIQIHFYPARYHPSLMSIFCMGDLCDYVADLQPAPNAVCLLEEPEHLNYYRAPTERGSVWQKVFGHVVGILHTNYRFYAAQHNVLAGPLVGAISAWMVQAYCDKVIKLSAVLQEYAPEKEVVANVHGIRSGFLQAVKPDADGKIYFVGKLLWAKGLDRLLDLQAYYRRQRGNYFAMDIYGSGPEQEEIRKAFLGTGEATSTTSTTSTTTSSTASSWSAAFRASTPLPVTFPGRLDHAAIGPDYKIFLNPSLSEVLCTTTAEALAMGKFVIIPKHSSNSFFEDFRNCRSYSSKQEFVAAVDFCLTHAPQPLSDKERYTLTWEAATARLVAAAQVSERDAARRERIRRKHGDDSATTEQRIAALHYALGKGRTGDVLRKVLGGGPVAEQFQYHHLSSSSLKEDSKQQQGDDDTIGLVTVQTAA